MDKQYEEKVPVTIYATDHKGEMFAEDASTHTLALGWIKLPIRHKVNPGSEIIVFNKSNGNQAEFVIEGQEGGLTKAVLKDIGVDIWEKDFGQAPPPEPDLRTSVHLVCKSCGTRESVRLEEAEKMRVLAGESVWRHCANCVDQTDWQSEAAFEEARQASAHTAPPPLPSALQRGISEPPPPPPPAAAAPAPVLTGAERRTSRRIQMKTTARVRRASGGMEVIAPTNVSRGGIAFTSRGSYELDERIFVAMHYRPGGEALETPGAVVRVTQLENGFGYGIRFD